MDKLEYIPGDLVMTNGVPFGTSKNVVYRVVESDPSKTLLKFDNESTVKGTVRLENYEAKELGDKGYLSGDCGAWVKDIVPIPLTPEILKKNGWKKKMYCDWCYYLPIEGNLLYLSKGTGIDGAFSVCVGQDMSYIASISFVHQLQHLLFGLGINHEMEV